MSAKLDKMMADAWGQTWHEDSPPKIPPRPSDAAEIARLRAENGRLNEKLGAVRGEIARCEEFQRTYGYRDRDGFSSVASALRRIDAQHDQEDRRLRQAAEKKALDEALAPWFEVRQ